MTKVLVTGGSGMLGRRVVSRLAQAGYTVRVMSHQQRKEVEGAAEWAQANLATGTGLRDAVAGVDTIVHSATQPKLTGSKTDRDELGNADVYGTRLLLEAAREAGVSHCLYVSIVGLEDVPMPYFRQKLATETMVQNVGVPWTIARATQFHPFIATFLDLFTRSPLFLFPANLPFQPVAADDVADYLCRWVEAGPSGRVTDFGGPEVLRADEMMKVWLREQGKHRLIIPIRWPGKIAAAIRKGGTLPRNGERGQISWAEWVREQAALRRAKQPLDLYPLRR
ncbi:MAG: hypothetical protein DLM69_09750 [Candidatus Chloroheliales bacterium]|nr:MAG: hypothetical protein DLM69_09750 [Chloroflexota bacterium]